MRTYFCPFLVQSSGFLLQKCKTICGQLVGNQDCTKSESFSMQWVVFCETFHWSKNSPMQLYPLYPTDSRVCVRWIRRRQGQPLPLTRETLCRDARPRSAPKRYMAKNCPPGYVKFARFEKNQLLSSPVPPWSQTPVFLSHYSFSLRVVLRTQKQKNHGLFSSKLLSLRVLAGRTWWASPLLHASVGWSLEIIGSFSSFASEGNDIACAACNLL